MTRLPNRAISFLSEKHIFISMTMKPISLAGFSLCLLLHSGASFAGVNPTPHSRISESDIRISKPESIRLTGSDQADKDALRVLAGLFPEATASKGFSVRIGEQNDKSVRKYRDRIPQSPEGYFLKITPSEIIIAGYDERGTYYGVQTLAQLLQNNTLPVTEIADSPALSVRGVVEGFYGTPWSHEARISQLRFYGRHKMNTYIYGPKDDPYHSSPHWRDPYPREEAERLAELVTEAHRNKVDFVWAIHPGKDIRWNAEDEQALLRKFEKMYELGVRSFAVFFDDIAGDGTDPVRQAALLNYLNKEFVQVHSDVKPLIMCPTQYNKAWSDPKPGTYLDILGDQLDPSVHVMWTGDRVIADITVEGLQWINKRLKRNALFWWNFPVSDYVRDHLLLGKSYGLEGEAAPLLAGVVSNPMERAEASKSAIYSVADYCWNTRAYDPDASWERSFREVAPWAPEAYARFAAHHSDLGANGHGYRREESVAMLPAIHAFYAAYNGKQDLNAAMAPLTREFAAIEKTPALLRREASNSALIQEVDPWLMQFEVLGKAGQQVLKLPLICTRTQAETHWRAYREWMQLDQQRIDIDKKYNQNPYQPGVKSGSLHLQPLVDSIARCEGIRLLEAYGGTKPAGLVLTAPRLVTDIRQLRRLPVRTEGSDVVLNPVLEVIRIAPDQFVGVELPLHSNLHSLALNVGVADAHEWGVWEVSIDGTHWQPLTLNEGNEQTHKLAKSDEEVRFVRFRNNSKEKKEFFLKRFELQCGVSNTGESPMKLSDFDLKSVCALKAGEEIDWPLTPDRKCSELTVFSSALKQPVAVFGIQPTGKQVPIGQLNGDISTLKLPEGAFETIRFKGESGFIHEIVLR